ncbi:hypothetical protein V6N13_148233 [Hibiscus sabdariffa]
MDWWWRLFWPWNVALILPMKLACVGAYPRLNLTGNLGLGDILSVELDARCWGLVLPPTGPLHGLKLWPYPPHFLHDILTPFLAILPP